MGVRRPIAALVLVCLAGGLAHASSTEGVEIPLSLWTDSNFPDGLPVGDANGISWGDYDSDGFIDMFVCQSGNLWRNVGGLTWEFAADLDALLPPTTLRYSSSFADYDNDGLLDVATEPRTYEGGDDFLHLLRNLGGGANFVDVATDPLIVDVQPWGSSETLCWGDVDDDGNLDLFVPVYPDFFITGQPGNFFLHSLGPTGPSGAYRFVEKSARAGLDIPFGNARPEGAQFVDVDFDGDLDLYSNGSLYRNASSPGVPAFAAMAENASGIGLSVSLDEGALFFDYDLDGDYDLFVTYVFDGVLMWESQGDGTFVASDPTIIDAPFTGTGLGISAEDWDNDGDIDFTTREVFRRNRLIEDGTRNFSVATHSIPADDLNNALPAWGDWDRDGDFDCALANFTGDGTHIEEVSHFYENTLYSASTPDADRRNVRIRPVGSSASVTAGLENQYGASVEIHLMGDDPYRRKKFVASSHGYLNQNEYTLSFGLPEDPLPADPDEDLHFDVTVDFPSLPANGLSRVDKHVNAALGDINLATLLDREIKVHRCGEVVIDGVLYEPPPLASARTTITAGGLALPTASSTLVEPTTALPDTFVGLAFNTLDAADSVRVKEIILDGTLDAPSSCVPQPFNIAFWDVTDAATPVLVGGGTLNESTSVRNHRSYFRTDLILEPQREYRAVARVTGYRPTARILPIQNGPVEVTGGLLFEDVVACDGQAVTTAVEKSRTYLALRFDPAGVRNEWMDPVDDTLTLSKTESGPRMSWIELDAASTYEILRCAADAGPCVPTPYAISAVSDYTDNDATGDLFWYEIRAVGECSARTP